MMTQDIFIKEGETTLNDYGIGEDVGFAAQDNLESNRVILIAISGKMGSGKDTVGDSLLDKLSANYSRFIDLSFGKLIREEVSHIQLKRQNFKGGEFGSQLQKLSEEINADLMNIKQLLQIVKNDDVYMRSKRARKALQFWGDFRRGQDSDYWIKSLGQEITWYLANGYSVNVTDVRFPKEVELIEGFHKGKVIRLEVDEETRLERMLVRDGSEVDKELLAHRTEIALDNYEFDRVFNNDNLEEVINEIVKYIKEGE